MAARVTVAEVEEILDTTLEDKQVRAFISAADTLVTDILAGGGHSTKTLVEITRWLSAHLATVRELQVTEEKIGDASIKYQKATGLGLDNSHYGQYVKILDTSGKLAALGSKKARVEVAIEVEDAV